jgi:hypothetical protein
MPSGGATALRFAVPARGLLKVGIYDVGGRLVRDLLDPVDAAGGVIVNWDGRTGGDRPAGPGVYYVRGVFHGADGRMSAHQGRLVILK